MNESNERRRKDIDAEERSFFLRTFFGLLAPLTLLLFFVFGFGIVALVASVVLSGVLSAAITFTFERIGRKAGGGLYGGIGEAHWTKREQLSVDIDQVKYFKKNKRYDDALNKVSAILEQDPEFPEALLLKAQILWEGFEKKAPAQECLKKVMEAVPDKNHTLHRWASNLYDTMNRAKASS
jgi:tetratricopeptide (TPR) repeat protein